MNEPFVPQRPLNAALSSQQFGGGGGWGGPAGVGDSSPTFGEEAGAAFGKNMSRVVAGGILDMKESAGTSPSESAGKAASDAAGVVSKLAASSNVAGVGETAAAATSATGSSVGGTAAAAGAGSAVAKALPKLITALL